MTYDIIVQSSDGYFDMIRTMNYQLIHAPSTRTRSCIPFIVLVTPNVAEAQIDLLRREGATVHVVDPIRADWIEAWPPHLARWSDVFTKLAILNMTQYERVAFIDADTMIVKRLDDLFDDPAVANLVPALADPAQVATDEAPQPASYVFAGVADHHAHDFPPPRSASDHINAGFFVVAPSSTVFDYYMSVMNTPWRFWPQYPEQNMLDYIHRFTGNLPWSYLHWQWNALYGTSVELRAGVRTFHGKYWNVTGDSMTDPELMQLYAYQAAERDAFYSMGDMR